MSGTEPERFAASTTASVSSDRRWFSTAAITRAVCSVTCVLTPSIFSVSSTL